MTLYLADPGFQRITGLLGKNGDITKTAVG